MKRGSIVFGIVALLLLADGTYLDATNNQVGGDQGAFFGNANVVLSAGTTVLVAGGLLAIGAIIMRPKTKPPWTLAHSAISGSSQNDGAVRRSAAAISSPIQTTMMGKASTCGRANRCGAVSASATATKINAALSLKLRTR